MNGASEAEMRMVVVQAATAGKQMLTNMAAEAQARGWVEPDRAAEFYLNVLGALVADFAQFADRECGMVERQAVRAQLRANVAVGEVVQ